MAGGSYEAGLWIDAVLLWDRNDASSVYSGNPLNPDFYYWLPGIRLSFVLLLKTLSSKLAYAGLRIKKRTALTDSPFSSTLSSLY